MIRKWVIISIFKTAMRTQMTEEEKTAIRTSFVGKRVSEMTEIERRVFDEDFRYGFGAETIKRHYINVERLNISKKGLDQSFRDQLFSLMEYGYDGVKRDVFEHDLFEKDIIFIVRDKEEIVGFSTLAARHPRGTKNSSTYFFSGDTILLKKYWGKSRLHRHIIRYLRNFKCDEKVYALASMHPRTYFIIKYALRNEIAPSVDSGHERTEYDQLCQNFVDAFPEKILERAGKYMKLASNYHVSENIMQLSQQDDQRKKWREYKKINPTFKNGDEILTFHRVLGRGII